MNPLLRLLNSRKLAVILLAVLLLILIVSSYFPSEFTVTSEAEWDKIRTDRPVVYEISKYLSTTEVVKSRFFAALSGFLFLSTITCTILRLRHWLKARNIEFEKDKAFSFSREVRVSGSVEDTRRMVNISLSQKGWQCVEQDGLISAQRGVAMGFWGSVMFHSGLVIVFLAAPVTAITIVNGHIDLTDDITVPSIRGYASGYGASRLPDIDITAKELWGKYYEGFYHVDFGGTLKIGSWESPVRVNKPAFYDGYQIALSRFGYAPCLEITRGDESVLNSCITITEPLKGRTVSFEEGGKGLTMFLMLFPDFYREGGVLKSRGREANNPMLLVKFSRDGKPLHKGLLLKPAEAGEFEGLRVSFPELRKWAGFNIVKESGVIVVIIGSIIGIPGLLIRFMSNERRLEFEFREEPGDPSGTDVVISGYSRYYPAFLEKEVTGMAEMFY